MNFYRKYPGDYARDTAHLSFAEHGVYNLLLDHCYATETPLPNGLTEIYRICRAMTDADRKVVQSVCKQFFPVNGEGRINPRFARQLPDEQLRCQTARANGRKGGRPITHRVSGTEPNGIAKPKPPCTLNPELESKDCSPRTTSSLSTVVRTMGGAK